ncbi:MAG: hypothetical protein O2930_06970 [Acidobacteria bacterium]|nr:hypothetical protein [Acidobacteriota bacterium]
MIVAHQSTQPGTETTPDDSDLRVLFHQLNNQLGIILAHAELLELKVTNESHRARASQVVSSVLDAMGTARQIRLQSEAVDR